MIYFYFSRLDISYIFLAHEIEIHFPEIIFVYIFPPNLFNFLYKLSYFSFMKMDNFFV